MQPGHCWWAILPTSEDPRGDRASRTSTVTLTRELTTSVRQRCTTLEPCNRASRTSTVTLVRSIPSCARQCCTTLEPCLTRAIPRRGKWTGFAGSTRAARVRPGAVRRPQRTIFTQYWRRRNLSASGDLSAHPHAAHWVLRGRPHQANCICMWCPWGACAHPAGSSWRRTLRRWPGRAGRTSTAEPRARVQCH